MKVAAKFINVAAIFQRGSRVQTRDTGVTLRTGIARSRVQTPLKS